MQMIRKFFSLIKIYFTLNKKYQREYCVDLEELMTKAVVQQQCNSRYVNHLLFFANRISRLLSNRSKVVQDNATCQTHLNSH